jgi:hypothetical protein
MAARAHLALVDQENSVSIITSLLPSMSLCQNQIHGQLLCIRYIVSAVCQNQARQGVTSKVSLTSSLTPTLTHRRRHQANTFIGYFTVHGAFPKQSLPSN